jgi:dihydroorotate dehydrogenase (fumarate)
MADLSTTYMGLELGNPVVVSSSSLTKSADGVRRCAESGAGAVVLKSLFEEQIEAETRDLEQGPWASWHTEAFDYVRGMRMELGPSQYLNLIEESKGAVEIPVIASLNCISPRWWTDYARQIEEAGADAIELNISMMPSDPKWTGSEIERLYIEVFEDVRSKVKIPVSVKLGPFFTSVSRMARELDRRGVAALVLFNRFYQVDIRTDPIQAVPGSIFSTPQEKSLPLRWIALLSDSLGCDLAASTGFHSADDIVKGILAGARAVQVCSALYVNKIEHLKTILEGVRTWMDKHGFSGIDDFRGKVSRERSGQSELYERLQYIKALGGIE